MAKLPENVREKLATYPRQVKLGVNAEGETVYMQRPNWDCDWYWGFGYIGHKDLHLHLDSLGDKPIWDALRDYLPELVLSDSQVWTFCELVKTVYTLREVAGIYNRGGSHITSNPCKEVLLDQKQYELINFVQIPALIDEIYKLFAEVKS